MNKHTIKIGLLALAVLGVLNTDAQKRSTKKKKAPAKKTTTAKLAAKTTSTTVADATAAITSREGLGDTTSPRVVTITSAFKPSLKTAAKINFTAASPVIDSSRTPVSYSVPAQNLFFSYQPVPISPLALPIDTSLNWQNDHMVKAGVGNFNSILLQGAFSFGDGVKSNTVIQADYLGNKGNLFAQQYTTVGIGALSVFNTQHTNEWTAKANYRNTTRYFYGFDPSAGPYTKSDLMQRFSDAGIEIGLRNKRPNDFRISYAPKLNLHYFQDNRQGKEFNAILDAPLRKQFGEQFSIELGITADVANATFPFGTGTRSIQNNLYYVSPSVAYTSAAFRLQGGIRPSWDNGKFNTLPNITAEVKIKEADLVAEAGWVGYFNKNGYRTLTGINPWIAQPTILANTKITEQYAGIRGSAGNHLTYRARLSFMRMNNQPLFPTAGGDGKMFQVVFEPELDVLQVHGELGYTLQEKLSLMAGITYRRFTSQELYERPWGLLPTELSGSLKWKVLKDLQVKADAFIWDGSYYRDRNQLSTFKLDPAADLNIGAEFSVMPKLNLWIQINNVLNNKYRRWNQYEVMGLNVLGGVVYSFR